MKMCVTGGSGFIGSHLVNALSKQTQEIKLIDKNKPAVNGRYFVVDLSKEFDSKLIRCNTLYHFAAYPDVKASMYKPKESIENNILATSNVLEACRKEDVEKIIFASTSAVYGNASTMPTPEDSELKPISVYGATKVACEMLIRSYHETYGISCIVLRYANIYGSGSKHGVIYDFVEKLRMDSKKLEILGNGQQSKSYLYIKDAIDATLLASQLKGWQILNIGSKFQTKVLDIAAIVIESMGSNNTKIETTGGEGGWPGDIPKSLLDISKIEKLGWKEKTPIKEGIRNYVKWLVAQNV